MTRGFTIAMAFVALAACTSDSERSRGIGFDSYSTFELERAEREAALSSPRGSIVPPPRVTAIPGRSSPVDTASAEGAPATVQAIPSSALAEAGIGQPRPPVNTATDPGRTAGLDASPGNAAPVITNNPGISDEQNFDAVATRETIESDAQRRAAQAAAREQITPTAVPERPSTTGPNIVAYAINAPNVKGQEWYSRSLLTTQGRYIRNCAAYANADEAQRDFLARGGPERDRLGIDPDGDGFACGWDPAPFKRAAGN
ncbi:hypothetical protein [Yoonia sp.]|uniref:hypothetical protein n=1 Tax=Yoonia sp. TaxID=2212373 RepID=UPI003F6A5872